MGIILKKIFSGTLLLIIGPFFSMAFFVNVAKAENIPLYCDAFCKGEDITISNPIVSKQGVIDFLQKKNIQCICNPLQEDNIPALLVKIMDRTFVIVLSLAVLMVAFGAFIIVTSAGEPEKTKKGRQILIWSAIGVAVAMTSRMVSSIIQKILTG